MKLHRDLEVTQKTAWFMAHRIRQALSADDDLMRGPAEMDETYLGGRWKGMHAARRKTSPKKAVVAGIKDRDTGEVRAQVIEHPDKNTLLGMAERSIAPGAIVSIDDLSAYTGLPVFGFRHGAVVHSRANTCAG